MMKTKTKIHVNELFQSCSDAQYHTLVVLGCPPRTIQSFTAEDVHFTIGQLKELRTKLNGAASDPQKLMVQGLLGLEYPDHDVEGIGDLSDFMAQRVIRKLMPKYDSRFASIDPTKLSYGAQGVKC